MAAYRDMEATSIAKQCEQRRQTLARFSRANQWLTWAYSKERSWEHAVSLLHLIRQCGDKRLQHITMTTLALDAQVKLYWKQFRN